MKEVDVGDVPETADNKSISAGIHRVAGMDDRENMEWVEKACSMFLCNVIIIELQKPWYINILYSGVSGYRALSYELLYVKLLLQ